MKNVKSKMILYSQPTGIIGIIERVYFIGWLLAALRAKNTELDVGYFLRIVQKIL